MINLTFGTTANVYLTLSDSATLSAPNYLFVFTHRTSNVITSFVKLNGDDQSEYKDRYNLFSFDVDQLFDEVGEYYYEVYEQESSSNLCATDATSLLETGIMRLSKEDEDNFTFKAYQTENTFQTR